MDMELSGGYSDGEAQPGAASTLIPILNPDSLAAFAGWVTRWSNCPICHSWLEATGLSSAPVFGEQWGFFAAWVSGFFLAQVPGPCPRGHPSLDKAAPQIHPAAPRSLHKQWAQGAQQKARSDHPYRLPPCTHIPTSAPWSVPPRGSLYLGGVIRNVSIPPFQVSLKLLGMNMPLTAQHGFRSSCPRALKLRWAAEIPPGMQKAPWEPHRSQPSILGCSCTS